jgi:hypothetical protein
VHRIDGASVVYQSPGIAVRSADFTGHCRDKRGPIRPSCSRSTQSSGGYPRACLLTDDRLVLSGAWTRSGLELQDTLRRGPAARLIRFENDVGEWFGSGSTRSNIRIEPDLVSPLRKGKRTTGPGSRRGWTVLCLFSRPLESGIRDSRSRRAIDLHEQHFPNKKSSGLGARDEVFLIQRPPSLLILLLLPWPRTPTMHHLPLRNPPATSTTPKCLTARTAVPRPKAHLLNHRRRLRMRRIL